MSIDWSLLAAPFAAGLLVLATHVPLGIEVLRRGIIFIDLAIAQVAALGVIAAGLAEWESAWGVQLSAMGAAVAGALLLTWTERRWPDIQEALIGLLFVVAAAAGILLLAGNPHGGEHLRDLLAGQILWVGWVRLVPVAALYAAILGLWMAFGNRIGRVGFHILFALAVTASVQLVGVLLVFVSLIAPALALRRLAGWRRLSASWALGAAGYGAGLLFSALFDVPAGAAIVCCLAAFSVAALALEKAAAPAGRV
ncbi:MAG: metal ABC transporter permease [Candidatus Nitricoxidivorans perseverans]|uniref:Metal ABC transporter permease n=1 Tax=Candidatus Nitricoxidivorans perseverans TaxID=2975601 RepID=A0AA49FJ09_9PROT|nr:MAG: metal ABC transporter permease [Candidatus Nitricoxidivorans perseverans]